MPTPSDLRIIEVTGTPRERGRQYGAAAADLIELAIAYYRDAFRAQTGLDWPAVTSYVKQWLPLLERDAPHLVDELAGVAEGAHRTFEELLALNVRGEMIYDLGSGRAHLVDEEEVDGCTSFLLAGAASGTGHTYVGQNWDWREAAAPTTLILRVVQDPLPTLIMQVEAGQIGRHGASSAGIALNANGLGGPFDDEIGMPQTFIRRMVLDQTGLGDAVQTLVRTKPHIASNALLAHRSGYGIDLEITPHGVDWILPEGGAIVHGNHYQASVPPQLAGHYRPIAADSLVRLPRAQALLGEVATATTHDDAVARIHAAMADHLAYPDSVCAHPDERKPAGRRWATLLSSCVDLTTGEYLVAAGTPCTHDYQRLPWSVYDGPDTTPAPHH